MKKWYVVHTQTGYENKAKLSLLARAEREGCADRIPQVLIPTEKVSEVKSGKKKILERKFYPGYILVEMDLDDKTWYIVKNTPGISGFVGSRTKPTPLSEADVKEIIDQEQERAEKPKPKTEYSVGESVRVKEGAFSNMNGTIEEVNPQKGKLKVSIVIFGRSTPAELEYWQIEKL